MLNGSKNARSNEIINVTFKLYGKSIPSFICWQIQTVEFYIFLLIFCGKLEIGISIKVCWTVQINSLTTKAAKLKLFKENVYSDTFRLIAKLFIGKILLIFSCTTFMLTFILKTSKLMLIWWLKNVLSCLFNKKKSIKFWIRFWPKSMKLEIKASKCMRFQGMKRKSHKLCTLFRSSWAQALEINEWKLMLWWKSEVNEWKIEVKIEWKWDQRINKHFIIKMKREENSFGFPIERIH